MALVLDTGVLLAAIEADDPDHERCASLMLRSNEQLVVPALVLVELDYWLRKLAGPEPVGEFAREVADGVYVVHPITAEGLVQASELQIRYADLRLGLVDASVFIACVDLGESKVATLDRRHFSVLRTPEGRSLLQVPE